jgi:beta-galactosidase
MISICDGWQFSECWSDEFLAGGGDMISVRLPHTVREVPLHYAAPEDYSMVCGYRRVLNIPQEYSGKRLFLQFDGAAHIATVYVNGQKAGSHRCGYTAFRVEITKYVNFGEDNIISVKLDCTENSSIPPFGFVIDYLTYGGLYREAWLDVREQVYIDDIYITTPLADKAVVKVTLKGGDAPATAVILDGDTVICEDYVNAGTAVLDAPGVQLWSPDTPKLYTCKVTLDNGDTLSTSFGFRTAEFKSDGLYINNQRIFMRGLNRHQCYPYIGYAAPESLQREDARILRHELGCNAVRTSHYPQSQYFIDECDREGLLVFTEFPGWQHIGSGAWKVQALANLREMILQYRNHPSIILWGVRINESVDDDEFYKNTNALAHQLDPSRATSGVRYLEKSSLLEDVYSYNDFSHCGNNPGVKPKNKVTPDVNKALIVSEHNGHMFPTKSYDPWQERQEQALRHARVLNDAAADGDHAGCFGWCMFDYPTHKDFGSGDRVCYHGVMDAFRNPKLAAALYASQSDEHDVLEVGSPMDIGDYAAGNIGDIYVFTNADKIDLYKNDEYVTSFTPGDWAGLAHPPVHVDDTIGCLLETQEGCSGKKEKLLHDCLISAGKHGLANMPLGDKLKMLRCMAFYKLSFEDGVRLYGKYVGNWGGEATRWRFEGKRGDKTVISQTRAPGRLLHIDARASSLNLHEGASYDMALIRVRLLDEYNNTASYAQLPVSFDVSGDLELVGPKAATAEGGMCGCYVKTVGKSGRGELKISVDGLEIVSLEFNIA